MKSNKLIAAILTIVMMLSFCACGNSQQPMNSDDGGKLTNSAEDSQNSATAEIVCKLQPGIYAPDSPLDHFYISLESALEAAFEGRLDLEILPQDSIGDAEIVEQCMMGTADMINIGDISFDIISGTLGWAFLPMMYEDYEDVDAKYFDGWVSEEISACLADMGLVRVGYSEAGFRQVCNNKHVIDSIDDFNGVKLRVAQLSYLVDFYTACGALPVTLSNSEVASGIEQGTIDGQDNYVTAFYNLGTLEMTPYITMLNYLYCANSLCVSQNFWNSLSADDQQLFMDTCMAVSSSELGYARDYEQNLLDEAVSAGTVELCYPDEEFKAALKEAAMTVWETESPKYDEALMERVYEDFGF